MDRLLLGCLMVLALALAAKQPTTPERAELNISPHVRIERRPARPWVAPVIWYDRPYRPLR